MSSIFAPSFTPSVSSFSAASISAASLHTRGCILRSVAVLAVVALSICAVEIDIATFPSAPALAVAAVTSVRAPLAPISALIFCTRGCILRSVAADAIVAVVALSICPIAIATFRSAALAVAMAVNRIPTAV